MSKTESPKYVTALFPFKGTNNDELCFKKGDVITITQMDDEGWWEGTLHDKTGWFPANYVKECRLPESGAKASPEKGSPESPARRKTDREIVLKDIADSERVNVAELQGLINSFLHPLESAAVLSKEEYKQLLGNIQEILEIHRRLLSSLEAAVTQSGSCRVGNLFLTLAPKMKSLHTTYCGNHPRAVCILDRYRDELNEFMERNGAIAPGILVLTTGLSKPFRRLDKYSAMLQELDRHTEKSHPDRGDIQRGVAVYREIADRCAAIRKQRELALQVLTGGIKGWEGEELSSLGEIVYVGPVTLASGATGQDRRDRYFVLFSATLLVLGASPRMSSFVYEGKLPLTGIAITPIQDTDEVRHAFEITGPMIESILVLCASKEDRQRWIELLIQEQTTDGRAVKTSAVSRVSCTQPPYTRLSRYFARMVKRKLIRPELLKKLLYLQYVLKPDTSRVKMRRAVATTYAVYPVEGGGDGATRCSSASGAGSVESRKPSTRKSTLTLDVKYVGGDIDLRTVGLSKGSPLSEAASAESGVRESSKSLPAVGIAADGVPSVLLRRNANGVSDAAVGSVGCRSRSAAACLSPGRHPTNERDDLARSGNEASPAGAGFGASRWESVEPDPGSAPAPAGARNRSRTRDELERAFQPNAASLGSSDSGMVESYRFGSSEIDSPCKPSAGIGSRYYIENAARRSSGESESDENSFEHQCVCTSPFDSTPGDSARSSASAKPGDNVSSVSIHATSIRLRTNEASGNAVRVSPDASEFATRRRFTQPIPYAHRIVPRDAGRRAKQPNDRVPENDDHAGCKQIYTSGLYAHWWLKKSIPLSGCSDRDVQSAKSPMDRCPFVGIKTAWSVASLRPAPPSYTCKACDERQFEEDAIILKVIEAYCLSVNARFTVHSGESTSMLEYDSSKIRERTSLTPNRGNWDFCSNRVLSETVKTLKSQMTELQSQMSLLTKQLDEERRSRLSLAATVKRSMAVADGSVP